MSLRLVIMVRNIQRITTTIASTRSINLKVLTKSANSTQLSNKTTTITTTVNSTTTVVSRKSMGTPRNQVTNNRKVIRKRHPIQIK